MNDKQIHPKVFVSHSHEDKTLAIKLSEVLRSKGVDAWIDTWEIRPGDSIVQKIFEEGLKDCQGFLILLSPDSIKSAWVRHELDSAMIQRLEGLTRVIPVVVHPCEIPVTLRPLLWLDISLNGMDQVVEKLVDVAFGRDKKPPLGPSPSNLSIQLPGLTNYGARLATFVSGSMNQPDGRSKAFTGTDLAQSLQLTPQQVNDAVDELEAQGLVKTLKWIGTTPYSFGQVEPTSSLPIQLRGTGALNYDPEVDVRIIAAIVVRCSRADGKKLKAESSLPPARINRAVSYLEDYGLVEVLKFLGTTPYKFGSVKATQATRHFVSQNT